MKENQNGRNDRSQLSPRQRKKKNHASKKKKDIADAKK